MTYQDHATYSAVAFQRPVPLAEQPVSDGIYRRFAKRALDIAIVAAVSLPVAMVVLMLALLVAFDGRSPFYLQARVGRGGRLFRMVKLRTMVWQADRVLDDYLATNPAARAEWDRDQKLRHDPRVTRIGAILRRASLDELPQLWNVLRGDMSIVGPRPMMDCQRMIYPGTEYYNMRPGITGFWQVSVRNESSFSERASFDRRYFHEMSLRTDLGVMWRTVGVVLRATGV